GERVWDLVVYGWSPEPGADAVLPPKLRPEVSGVPLVLVGGDPEVVRKFRDSEIVSWLPWEALSGLRVVASRVLREHLLRALRDILESFSTGQTEVLEMILSGAPLTEVLDLIVAGIERLKPGRIRGSIMLVGQDGEH